MPKEYSEQLLDEIYDGLEETTNGEINRCDLIIVDGKTVHERMAEEYIAQWKNRDDFCQYYNEHYKEKANQYVREALEAGKYVEIYRTDQCGNMEKAPEQLMISGKVPHQPEPVEMKGFADARERVRFYNANGQINMGFYEGNGISYRTKNLMGGWMKDNNINTQDELAKIVDKKKNTKNFSLQRNALSTFVLLNLAANYSNVEGVLDPYHPGNDQIEQARKAATEEVVSHLKRGGKKDMEWLGQMAVRGQVALLDELDKGLKRIDLNNEQELYKPENRKLFDFSQRVFDAYQEMRRMEEEVLAAAPGETEKEKKDFVDTLESRALNTALLFKEMKLSLNSQITLCHGVVSDNRAGMEVLNGQCIRTLYAARKAENPGKEVSMLFSADENLLYSKSKMNINEDKKCQSFATILKDPKAAKVVGQELFSGELQNKIKINVDFEKDTTFFSMKNAQQHIKDVMEFGKDRSDLRESYEKDYSSFCKFCRKEMEKVIGELHEADPPLVRSSKEYKAMQKGAQKMAEYLKNLSDPPTMEQIRTICSSTLLKEGVEAYKQHKKVKHSGSELEKRRMHAADHLMELAASMTEAGTVEYQKQQKEAERKAKAEAENRVRFKREVLGHLAASYGKNAPEPYREAGLRIKHTVVREEYGRKVIVTGKHSATENLRVEIMTNTDILSGYIDRGRVQDEQGGRDLINTVARMVLLEEIVHGRTQNGAGNVEDLERSYVMKPQESLKEIMQEKEFQKTIEYISKSSENLRNFVVNDQAKELGKHLFEQRMERVKQASSQTTKEVQRKSEDMNTSEMKPVTVRK